ncbi:hypothetical protein SOVF_147570 isoform A [Spinacia oleracea]|nr:hypothetical protein SOVF_147570 isoform A [Spinacia oleracea]
MQRDDYHFSSLSLVRSVSLFRTKARIESAWNSVNLYDVLTIIFDVHRHLSSCCSPGLSLRSLRSSCRP